MNSHRSQIGRRRLANQRLTTKRFAEPTEVVRWMGAMQAQDYGQSLWAIGCRLRTPSMAAVEEDIADGRIVRTWPMRGTIHWVPAEDARWLVALSADRTIAASRTRRAQLGLDEADIGRAGGLLAAELVGGRRLSRPAVMRLWESAGIATDGQRGYHLLWHLAHAGHIAIGPMEGRQQTFVLLDEWVGAVARGRPAELSRADGLVELARRYVRSHGPVGAHDFAWWAGITLTDARQAFAGNHFAVESAGERDLWSVAPGSRPQAAGAELLAGFDEFVIGYQLRSDVLDPEFADRVVPGNNGVFQPCVVADGRVVGTWKRLVRKGSVGVTVALFESGTVSPADLGAAAERYAGFLGVPLGGLTVGEPA